MRGSLSFVSLTVKIMLPILSDIDLPKLIQLKTELIQPAIEADERYVPVLVRWSWIILIIASTLQCVLFPDVANWICVGYIAIAWLIVTNLFLRPTVLEKFPFSTFLILGFATTHFYFPLLFTLLEGKPTIFNLELPYDVFFHSIAVLLVLVLSHSFYQITYVNVNKRAKSLLEKAGFFNPPTILQLWLMGLMGVAATFYSYIYTPVGWSPTGAASDKFIQSLIPFSYAPYFIPFGQLFGSKEKTTKKSTIALVLFTLFLFVISIARNNRTGFIVGFTSVGFSYGLGVLFNYFKPRFFTLRNAFIGIICLWIVVGPVADISTAMVMVRDDRHNVSSTELLERTAEAFFDKEGIRLYRLSASKLDENRFWDEHYLNNVFLARFCNLKFNDLSLMMTTKISIPNTDMLNYTINHFFSTLPTPLLDLLEINADKDFTNACSFGDYFHYKVSGDPWALGGFRTGHISGVSMAAFGWWYLRILGIGIIPVFVLFDKFTVRRQSTSALVKKRTYVVNFSMCGLLILTDIFRFLTIESVEGIGAFLLRGWFQTALLYFLFYHFTRIVSKLLPGISRQSVTNVRIVNSDKF